MSIYLLKIDPLSSPVLPIISPDVSGVHYSKCYSSFTNTSLCRKRLMLGFKQRMRKRNLCSKLQVLK